MSTMDEALETLKSDIRELSESYILRIKALRQVLKDYDDFSKSNGDWIDDENEGAPNFVLAARTVLDLTKEFEEKFLAIEGCITSLKEAVDTLNKNMEEKSKKKPVSEVDGGNPKKVEEEIEEAGKLAKKVNDEDPEEDPEEDPKKKCDDEKSMSDLQMLFKQEGELHTNASEELYLEVFDDTVNATTKEVHELVAEALQSELKKILGKV